MNIYILGFLLGDLLVQQFAAFASIPMLLSCLVALLGIYYFKKIKNQFLLFLMAFILGALWTTWYAKQLLAWELPKSLEKQAVLITGYIASMPVIANHQTNFVFALKEIKHNADTYQVNAFIKLTNRNLMEDLHVGDKYQFYARLKRIHSTQNPGSFDYEAWALQSGLRASGYVIAKAKQYKLAHDWYRYPVEQIREAIKLTIEPLLPDSLQSPWLLALIIGERGNVNQADWQVLRNTGTNHLMAIAGLHVGIVAGFIFTLVYHLWCYFPLLNLRVPAKEAATCAALIIAIMYSACAGFSIPTQRAIIMLGVFSIALLLRRKISPWTSWSLALLIVLLINPLSVLSESFWLSFATLSLIIYGMHNRLHVKNFWWKWGRVQFVIGVGLAPITLALFQEFSIVGFLANCIAIPWLAFFILPFCLLSTATVFIFPVCATFFLYLAGKSLSGLWWVLSWFSHLHFAAYQQVMPNHIVLVLTVVGILLLLSPKGFPGRWFSIIFLLPIAFYYHERPKQGDFWLSLLDVGQGLSLVIQTNSHTLVYDAGPKYSFSVDMGESVVLPYLRTCGVKKIDMLVISHADNDHIGGASALLKAFPINVVKTSDPEKIKTPMTALCQAGDTWQWDGVTFTFLYPFEDTLQLRNDSSCVLKIDNGMQSVLLTGDIERFAEKQLLRYASDKLNANILVAPHHGSKTSGLPQFIQAVHPQFVLYGLGYLNRYKFPHKSVVASYKAIQAEQYDTSQSGAIAFKLEQGKKRIAEPMQYRMSHARYWYEQR